jgi:hypothetical protein
MLANDYFQQMRSILAVYLDTDLMSRRYQYLLDQARGSDTVATPNCWLDLPTLDWGGRHDTVLATDEFFTYTTEDQQQQLIESVAATVRQRLIVTVRDFKNSYRTDVNSMFGINLDDRTVVVTENVRNHQLDRQAWYHTSYVIDQPVDQPAQVVTVGPVQRRAVYFKQLAKFCFDAGCKNFQVIPNVMFRPLFKKHLEHIIVADF